MYVAWHQKRRNPQQAFTQSEIRRMTEKLACCFVVDMQVLATKLVRQAEAQRAVERSAAAAFGR